jgi:KilA-N domain
MSKPKKSTIEVQGSAITILAKEHGDYISLTDMVRNFDGGSALIEQWLKNKDTVIFLGVWEQIHNPKFNSLEFEGIRNDAGRNSFFLCLLVPNVPLGTNKAEAPLHYLSRSEFAHNRREAELHHITFPSRHVGMGTSRPSGLGTNKAEALYEP